TPRQYDRPPLQTLAQDAGTIIRNAYEIPNIFLPLPRPGVDVTTTGLCEQVALLVASLAVTAVVLISFATGFPAPFITAAVSVTFVCGLNWVWGKSRVVHQPIARSDTFEKETWLFVNGIATSRSGLKLILRALQGIFGRRVIGVHNRTFGIWFDLLECVLQRDLLWPTTDVREGYNIIARHVADPRKTRIVLMGHSQGGIILSAWIDQLLSDFSADQLRKVEIYSFASAANHFSVPTTESGPVFARVEHFVNTKDYVSIVGLLSFAPPCPASVVPGQTTVPAVNGRFGGRIFKRLGETGHLLLTH
ncbi:hypothetical protein P7C73_g3538, partial [Tremellales sp. Uapishka_1]